MVSELRCTICDALLTGDLDTYGDVGAELCIDCWYNLPEQLEPSEWYGMDEWDAAPPHSGEIGGAS